MLFPQKKGNSYGAKPDKVNDGAAFVRLCLQGDSLIVVEVDSPRADGFLSGITLVGESLMQLRLVEGEDDFRKSDVVAVPVLLRMGQNNDMIFRKRWHCWYGLCFSLTRFVKLDGWS